MKINKESARGGQAAKEDIQRRGVCKDTRGQETKMWVLQSFCGAGRGSYKDGTGACMGLGFRL